MSENTVKETKEKSKGSWVTNFIWAVVGAIIGIVLGYAIFTATLKDMASDAINDIQTTEDVQETGDASDGISTYTFEHTVLDGAKMESAINDINDRILNIMGDNNYLQLQVGEDEYEAYIYNSHGECFAQDSVGNYSAVFRDDKKVVKYTSENSALAIGTDIDILSIAANAAQAPLKKIENGSARLLQMKLDDESEVVEYRVDLVGDEAVRECYTSLGLNFADSMVNNLKEQLPDWEPHLIFVYLLSTTSDDISMHCYYVDDNTEYTNWVLQAYVPIGDWKLSEDWYNVDISTLDLDTFNSMIDETTSDISKLLDEVIMDASEVDTPDAGVDETTVEESEVAE